MLRILVFTGLTSVLLSGCGKEEAQDPLDKMLLQTPQEALAEMCKQLPREIAQDPMGPMGIGPYFESRIFNPEIRELLRTADSMESFIATYRKYGIDPQTCFPLNLSTEEAKAKPQDVRANPSLDPSTPQATRRKAMRF